MSNTYILVDVHNLFHRSKHVTKGDITLKAGMAVHIMFTSIQKVWNKFEGSHIVLCLEGKSWRRSYYSRYKRARREEQKAKTLKEQEEDEIFFEALNDFVKFAKEKTNMTVLEHQNLEADDLVSGWINNHPNDFHVIISGDSDFIQLLSDNVIMYDGVRGQTIKKEGYFDDKDQPIQEKKSKSQKKPKDPEYELFLKCIRGDATDGILSAYPRVRETTIKKAFEDRFTQGYDWNNLMQQTWKDADDQEHRVLDRYKENRLLIDLNGQPKDIVEEINNVVQENMKKKKVGQTGIHFLSFCERWELVRLSEISEKISYFLQYDYPEEKTS